MRSLDFAAQLNVSLANGWGIVRTVADLCLKMPEGKYVLVKDPNKVCPLVCFTAFLGRDSGALLVRVNDWPTLVPHFPAHVSIFSFVAGHPIVCRPFLCIRR